MVLVFQHPAPSWDDPGELGETRHLPAGQATSWPFLCRSSLGPQPGPPPWASFLPSRSISASPKPVVALPMRNITSQLLKPWASSACFYILYIYIYFTKAWLASHSCSCSPGDQGAAKQISCQNAPAAPGGSGTAVGWSQSFARRHRRGGVCPRRGVTAVGMSGTTLPQKSKPGI